MIRTVSEALAHKRSALGQKDKGFTLIELLVVVIIIGILAAIAIPVFLGQQDSAKDGGVKSDLATAKIAVVSFYTDGGTAAPTLDVATLGKYGFAISDNTASIAWGTAPTTAGTAFCINGVSKSTGATAFSVSSSAGVKAGAC